MTPVSKALCWLSRRYLGLALIFGVICATPAAAQNYELTFAQSVAGTDSLVIDVSIRSIGGSFNLGPSNIVFTLDPTCVDASRISIAPLVYLYNNNGPAGYGTITVGGTAGTGQINVTIAQAAGPGIAVPNSPSAPQLVARLVVPILSCTCTLNPTLSGFNAVATAAAPAVVLASPTVVAPPFSLAQPSITSGPTSLAVCASGVTSTYTSSTPGFWSISSAVGSVITTSTANVNTITVLHGVPAGIASTDVISVSPTRTSVCDQTRSTVLSPSPSLNFALVGVGSPAVCVGSPFQLQLLGSESGVSYQLLRDGAPTGAPVIGTGGPLLFSQAPLPLQSGPGYDYTYRASRTPCTVEQVPPGVEISVVNCNLPTAIAGPSSITRCGNSTGVFSIIPPQQTGSNIIWQVLNRSVPPVVSFTSGVFGASVGVNLGRSTITQTDTLVVTEILGSAIGRDSVYIEVRRAANPVITGKTFLFNPDSLTQDFIIPPAFFNPSSTYTWSTVPAPPTVSIDLVSVPTGARISFGVDGFYDVNVTETTIDGCTQSASLRIQVSSCNANPGTRGPDQIVCIGGNALVYVDNDFDAPSGLQWQRATSGSGPWTNATGGLGVTSQVYFTPPIVGPTYFRLAARGDPMDPDCAVPNTTPAIYVNAVPPPVAGTITPRDTGICVSGRVKLRATGGGGGIIWQQSINGITWTTAAGTGVFTDTLTSVPLTTTTNFRALFANGCDSVASNSVRIDIFQDPQGTATPFAANYSVCAGDITVPLVSSVTSFGGSGFWTTSGSGTFNSVPQYVSALSDSASAVTLSWVVTSGNCPPSVANIALNVDGPSRASFAPITPSIICAGGTTDTLNAVATRGTGLWTSSDPLGQFLPSAATPRAVYLSSTASGGSTVTLTWTVTSGDCPPVAIARTVNVNANTIGGAFPPLATPIVCSSDTTAPLGASKIAGTRAAWSSTGSGIFIPSDTIPNARYIPSASDQGTIVRLIWTISRAACTPLILTRDLDVRRAPRAVILNAANDDACYSTPYQLNGIELNGTGQWTILRVPTDPILTPPAGSFLPSATSSNATYVAGLSDTNRTFRVRWIVTGGAGFCDPDTAEMGLKVWGEPRGTFGTVIPAICAGSSTIPLVATVVAGQSGIWSTPNGSGTFSNAIDPNAFYNSDLPDAGSTIILRWTPSSVGCGTTRNYDRTVFVNPSTIIGTFSGAPAPLAPICFNTSTPPLAATVSAPSVAVWRHNGFGSFADSTNGNTVYTPSPLDRGTTVTLTWFISNPPCANRVLTRTLNVRDTVGAYMTPISVVCYPEGTDTLGGRIYGDPLATGTWSVEAAPPFAYVGQGAFTPNNNNRNARYLPAVGDVGRTFRLVWTVANGVCAFDTVKQTIRVFGASLISITGPPGDSICQGDTATLTSSGGSFFVWSGPNITSNSALSTIRVAPNVTASYTLLTGTSQCISAKNYLLNVKTGAPISAVQVSPGTICQGLSARLNVTGGDNGAFYRWSRFDGSPFATGEISNPNIEQPQVFPTATTVYLVRASTTNGCFAQSIVTVNVQANIPPGLQAVTQSCLFQAGADSVTFTPIYAPGTPPIEDFVWVQTDRATLDAFIFPNPTVPPISHPNFIPGARGRTLTVLSPGVGNYDYTLWYFNGTCASLSTTQLQVIAAPDADFTADRVSVAFYAPTINFTDLSSGGPGLAYLWDFGDTTVTKDENTSVLANPSHRYSRSGLYTVVLQATNPLGCADLEVKTGFITVLPESYEFPRAFTPDGNYLTATSDSVPDWINDFFRPLPLQGEPCVTSMKVYDAKGQLVYSFDQSVPQPFLANQANFGWNGKSNDGGTLDSGIYSYQVEIVTKINGLCTGPKQTYTGSITLVR